MAKKKKVKAKKTSGGISGKMIFGIAAAGLALMAFSSNSTPTPSGGGGDGAPDPCTAYYSVNGNRVCETALPDLGYIYWKGAASGDGWYKLTDFPVQYNMALATWQNSIRTLAQNTLNSASTQYTQSQNLLRNAYRGTSGPLQRA